MKQFPASESLSEKALPYKPLEGKTVLLGITGGIAAYKAADYSKKIRALGARVITVMTKHATEFVSPITFAALTGEKVYTDLFCVEGAETIPHIELARSADLFLVLPATANIIGKAANGLADDFLSTLLLAFSGPALCRNRAEQREQFQLQPHRPRGGGYLPCRRDERARAKPT